MAFLLPRQDWRTLQDYANTVDDAFQLQYGLGAGTQRYMSKWALTEVLGLMHRYLQVCAGGTRVCVSVCVCVPLFGCGMSRGAVWRESEGAVDRKAGGAASLALRPVFEARFAFIQQKTLLRLTRFFATARTSTVRFRFEGVRKNGVRLRRRVEATLTRQLSIRICIPTPPILLFLLFWGQDM